MAKPTDLAQPRILTLIESPFAASAGRTVEANIAYARRALLDSISRNETPLAGHLLYTQILDDLDPADRALGLALHLSLIRNVDKLAVYTDHGISSGMAQGIDAAIRTGLPITYRTLSESSHD